MDRIVEDEPRPVEVTLSPKLALAAARNGYDATQQVGHLLRKAYQRHMAIFAAIAADTSLTSVQFVTLCMLDTLGDCSQAELVRATAVDQASIRGVVERLKARSLVVLKRNPSDGRKVMIGLTRKGGDLLARMYPRARAITEETQSNLNSAERIALNFLLTKMIGGYQTGD